MHLRYLYIIKPLLNILLFQTPAGLPRATSDAHVGADSPLRTHPPEQWAGAATTPAARGGHYLPRRGRWPRVQVPDLSATQPHPTS